MSQKIICKIINFCPWISYPPQKLLVLIHKYSSTPSYDSSASKIFLSQSTCFYIVCVYGCLWISDSSIVLLFCIKLRGGKPKLYRFMLIVWITLYNMYFNVFSINLKRKFFFINSTHIIIMLPMRLLDYQAVRLDRLCTTCTYVNCNGSLVKVKLIVINNIYMYGFDYINIVP